MANSGIPWIDAIFDWCVHLLFFAAHLFGITYEEINVWLFVFILPTTLIASLALNILLFISRGKSKRSVCPQNPLE